MSKKRKIKEVEADGDNRTFRAMGFPEKLPQEIIKQIFEEDAFDCCIITHVLYILLFEHF